jgi:hypothetical protein
MAAALVVPVADSLEVAEDKVIQLVFAMSVLFVTTNTKVVHVPAVVQKCKEQIFRKII